MIFILIIFPFISFLKKKKKKIVWQKYLGIWQHVLWQFLDFLCAKIPTALFLNSVIQGRILTTAPNLPAQILFDSAHSAVGWLGTP